MKASKWKLAVPLAAVVGVLATACGGSASPGASAAPPATVRIAVDSTDLGMQPFVAQTEGMFTKHNISPDIRVFTYGIDGVDAVLTGQEDMAIACDFATLTRMGSNHLRILATTDVGTGDFAKLVVRGGINTGKDLAGKTMGVPLGTATQYATLKYLQYVGVSTSSVKFVNFTSAFDIVTALRAGRIDGAFVWGPAIAQAQSIPGTKTIAGDHEVPGASTICLAVASTDFLSKNEGAAANVLAAFVDAAAFVKKDPNKAATDLANGIGAKQSDALGYMQTEAFPVEMTKDQVQHLKDLVQFQLDNGVIKQTIDVNSILDLKPLKTAAPKNVTI